MLKLLIQDDEGHQTVVPLVHQEITIGRQPGNAVRLTERNVSRRHARLSRRNETVFVEDLDSSNGTQLNGEKLHGKIALKVGDHVRIGDYDLSIRSQDGRPELSGRAAVGTRPDLATVRLRPRKIIWRKWVAVALAGGAVAVAVAADRIFINARPVAPRESTNELNAIATGPSQPEVPAPPAATSERQPAPPASSPTDEQQPQPATATQSPAIDTTSPAVQATEPLRKRKAREPTQSRITLVTQNTPHKNSEQVKRFYQAGTDLLSKNDLTQAVDALNRCLALDPKFAKCHRMLGATYARLKNPELGAIHYRKFVQLAPDDPEAPKVRIFLEQYEATRGLSKKD